MMEAVFLGVVQGLTEFLPVSSSGHLVLAQHFVSIPGEQLFFDLALHMGTLLPVLWVFRDDLLHILRDLLPGDLPWREREGIRLLGWLVLGSIPTAALGLGLKDHVDTVFSSFLSLTFAFSFTAVLLYFSGRASPGGRSLHELSWKTVLAVGLIQGVAVLPGISRSGSTIALALFLGMRREAAARFSFLLSLPAITGGFLLELKDLGGEEVQWAEVAAGTLSAMVVGYIALRWLLKLVETGDFSRFSWYCGAVAAFSFGCSLFLV